MGADITTIISGIGGVIGFALLFTPVTILPGIILLGVVGGLGGVSGAVGGTNILKRNRRDKAAKTQLDTLFEKAGIDPEAFDKLSKMLLETGENLSKKHQISIEKGLECVQVFIVRIWSAVRVINKNTVIVQAFQNVLKQANLETNVETLFKPTDTIAEQTISVISATRMALKSAEIGVSVKTIQSIVRLIDGADVVSGTGNVVAAAKTFVNFSKGAQALQAIGLAFSLLSIGAGVHGVIKNSKKIKEGYRDLLADKLEMYEAVLENFLLLRQHSNETQ